MADTSDPLYLEMIQLLNDAARDALGPTEVNERIRDLAPSDGLRKVDLFWERDLYSNSYHYDALVRMEGAPAVTLSASPDHGIPWILRGSFRWNETVLVRVNNQRVLMFEAITRCDALWGHTPITARIVNGALVADYVEREGRKSFEVTDDEAQAAMDAIRIRNGLFTEEATRKWMHERGINHDTLEQMATEAAFGAKVRKHVTGGKEKAHFAAHTHDFDRAAIVEVRAKTAEMAHEVYRRASNSSGGLMSVLHDHALACLGKSELESYAQPIFRTLWRSPYEEVLKPVFAADGPTLLRPIEGAGGYEVIQVLYRQAATFDELTQQEVQRRLFEAWLDEQRSQARIEWTWERGAQSPS